MQKLVDLINYIKDHQLDFNQIIYDQYRIQIVLKYQNNDDTIETNLTLRTTEIDFAKCLDWYQIEQNHQQIKNWKSCNDDLAPSLDYFLKLLNDWKKHNVRLQMVKNHLHLLEISQNHIKLQYWFYEKWSVFDLYLLDEKEEPWIKSANQKTILALLEAIKKYN